MKMNNDIINAIENEDYQNVMEKACMKYRCILSRDEIESIKLNSLWKALDKYDDTKGTKFTSFLYRGTYQECKTYTKFIVKGRKTKSPYSSVNKVIGQYHPNIPDVGDAVASIDLMEELKAIEDGHILIDYYYNNLQTKEIASKYGLQSSVVLEKKKKAIAILKYRFI